MDEAEYWDDIEEKLWNLHPVAEVKQVGGERDLVAGQRDEVHTEYRLDIKAEVVEKIRSEREESDDDTSDTLTALRNELEYELGLSPGDYEPGHLYVTATYDNYPGGSI